MVDVRNIAMRLAGNDGTATGVIADSGKKQQLTLAMMVPGLFALPGALPFVPAIGDDNTTFGIWLA